MLPIKIDKPKDYFKSNIHKIINDYHNKIMTNIDDTQNRMDTFTNEHHLVYELFYDKKEIELMEKYHNRARILSTKHICDSLPTVIYVLYFFIIIHFFNFIYHS